MTDAPQPQEWNEQAKSIEAWRAARRHTFDAWLERSHRRIVELPGFTGLQFPGEHAEMRVRMATKDGAQAVLQLLRDARAEGVDVDPDRYVIVRESGADDSPYVIQSRVDGQ
jgi:hypothetical protein